MRKLGQRHDESTGRSESASRPLGVRKVAGSIPAAPKFDKKMEYVTTRVSKKTKRWLVKKARANRKTLSWATNKELEEARKRDEK